MNTEITYVLDQFCRQYGLNSQPNIGYGFHSNGYLRVSESGRGFLTERKPPDYQNARKLNFGDTSLPVIFHDGSGKTITHHENITYIHFDLFAEAFFWLSGWQECETTELDSHGRFPWKASLQYQWGITEIPVVNYLFSLLAEELGIKANHSEYAYRIALTHDVDRITTGWQEDTWFTLKKGDFEDAAKIIRNKWYSEHDWQNLQEIAQTERQYGATSSFYFIPRRGTYQNIKHADYDVRQEQFGKLLNRLEKQGSEIGLHPSVGSHQNKAQLIEDIALLGRPVSGGRFHYLMFNNRITPKLLEECGLKYDSTLGFAEHIGFRNGYCFPFYLYDHQNNRPTSVMELPLVIMDTTLRNSAYMGVSADEVVSKISPVLQEIKKFGGTCALLWHNNMFTDYKYRPWKQAYTEVLEILSEDGTELGSVETIIPTFLPADSK